MKDLPKRPFLAMYVEIFILSVRKKSKTENFVNFAHFFILSLIALCEFFLADCETYNFIL